MTNLEKNNLSSSFQKLYVDPISKHSFQIIQAQGLPEGERALLFHSSKEGKEFLSKNQLICKFASSLEIVPEEEFNTKGHIYENYSVQWKKNQIAIPSSIETNENQLGLLANTSWKEDPYRLKCNARLSSVCPSYLLEENRNEKNKIQIYLYSTCKIKKGDEILLFYGKEFTNYLSKNKNEIP